MLLCRLRGARGCAAEGEGALGSPGTSTGGRCAGGAGGGPGCPGPGLGGCPGAGAGVVRPRFSLPGASTVPPRRAWPVELMRNRRLSPAPCQVFYSKLGTPELLTVKLNHTLSSAPFGHPRSSKERCCLSPCAPWPLRMAAGGGAWPSIPGRRVFCPRVFALDTCRTGSDL